MKNETYTRFENTIDHLLQVLATTKQEDFNRVPFEGSWTEGQVTDHIVKSMGNIGHVLNANTQPADRAYDQHKAMMEQIFLNYDHKMKSPDFILPSNEPLEKGALVASITDIKATVLDVIKDADLTELCMSFEMPGLGYLTRYELIWFVIYHTQRHTHQLTHILEVIG